MRRMALVQMDRAEGPAGERRLRKSSAFSKWMFLCHSNKKQHLRLYVQSLPNATSGGFLFFLPFFYKYIWRYISYKRRVTLYRHQRSRSALRSVIQVSPKNNKIPKLFSVVFRHLSRQQRALAALPVQKQLLCLQSLFTSLKETQKHKSRIC